MIKTRTCTEKDVELVSNVLFESGLAKTKELASQIFLKEMKRGDRYIIAEDGKPLGVVSWIFHGEARHGLAELYHIGVIPSAQGKGIAPLLFQALIDDANQVYSEKKGKLRKLYLLTHEDNERAKGFYKKVGMVHDATLKDHFRHGLNELVFAKFFE